MKIFTSVGIAARNGAGIIRALVIPAFVLCSAVGAFAQEGIIDIRPASGDGGTMTMEDAVSGRPFRVRVPRIEGFNDKVVKNEGPVATSSRENGLSTIRIDSAVVVRAESPDIVYGESVSRNEFGISGGLFWSPDRSKLAFYRKDESRVGSFPLLDITTRTGSLKMIKYPMAGTDSEIVSLGVYDLASGSIVYLKVTDFDQERYLTNVTWSPDSKEILVQVLDRAQKNMHLNRYCARTGEYVSTVLTEHDDRYVEPLDVLHFLRDPQSPTGFSENWFIYRTDIRDGFRNLYLCNKQSGEVQRITRVDADVQYVYDDGHWVYYHSSELSPAEQHLFRTELKRNRKGDYSLPKKFVAQRLTRESGWHTASGFGEDGSYYDLFSSLNCPYRLWKCKAGAEDRELLFAAEDPTVGYGFCEMDFGSIRSADGKYDNHYRLIKPKDFDPSKKYPVIVYVYGGPHSQMVNNSWLASLRYWEMLMAQRGYLVYVQDNRGTLYHGSEYEKAIWGQCGKAEMEDQMEGVKMLCSLPYVDASRIGVHGWSYGGFMTISLMTTYPDVFKVGVAGGPVIDWKWYEVMYGERYMDSPQANPQGYESTSLVGKAANLKGKLLICQGAVDDTVVQQHCLNFLQVCIDAMVPVDYFTYPVAQHNVFGMNRVHLMDKVSDYFALYL